MTRRAFMEMLHLPTRREVIRTLAAGAAIAVVCWYFGVDAWHAILLGCAITVLALACRAAGAAPDTSELSWRPGHRGHKEGSRNDVANLAAALRGGWGFVGLTAERQLQQIARRRLALEGLDLGNPEHGAAIEQRLGSRVYRVLVNPRGRVPSLRTLIHCLDMLDSIDSTHYPAPAPGPRAGLRRARERR